MASVSLATGGPARSPWRTRSAPPERPCPMTSSTRSGPAPLTRERIVRDQVTREGSNNLLSGLTPSSHHPLSPLAAVGAGIYGIGSYVPERVMTNADLEKLVETSDEWIVTRTGISERRIVAEGQATSDLA